MDNEKANKKMNKVMTTASTDSSLMCARARTIFKISQYMDSKLRNSQGIRNIGRVLVTPRINRLDAIPYLKNSKTAIMAGPGLSEGKTASQWK